jgi:hypothetical protein
MEYRDILNKMIRYFPKWSDIRKRTDKTVGGALLKSYAMEADNLAEAIKKFREYHFLVYYSGIEDTIVDYLLCVAIGNTNDSITVESLTEAQSVDDFYDNLDTTFLYKDGYLLLHEKSGYKENDNLTYYINGYTYMAKLSKRHVWNIFDEFALFAGIKRYDGESNFELSQRTYAVFKYPAASNEDNLKNAIVNSMVNIYDLHKDDIIIEPLSQDNILDSDDEYGTIYERISEYNKDLFKNKRWDTSAWENDFATIDYIPHIWDKEIQSTQNGVGYNDSCKIDFIENIDSLDTTDLDVSYYKKSQKAITEYIKNNNIETTIPLKLTKYSNTINPQDIEYKITASEVLKIDPYNIYINSYEQINGEKEYYIDDLAIRTQNITEQVNNVLDNNTLYRLVFNAVDMYSDIKISKLLLDNSINGSTDLRSENKDYIFKNGSLSSKYINLHATSTSDLTSYDNLANVPKGISLDSLASTGTANIDVTGMSFNLIKTKVSCREVNITDNTALVSYYGFELSGDNSLIARGTDSTSNIVIDMKCNSYSFTLSSSLSQGAIEVTEYINNKYSSKITYSKAQTIHKEFDEFTPVKIVIRKDGRNPVIVTDIKAARYEIEYSLDNGTIIKNAMYTMLPSFTGNNTMHVKLTAYSQVSPVIEYIHIASSFTTPAYTVDIGSLSAGTNKLFIDTTCKVSLYLSTDNGATYNLENDNYTTHSSYFNNSSSTGYIYLDLSKFSNITSSTPAIQNLNNNKCIELAAGENISTITIDAYYFKKLDSYSLDNYLINSKDEEVYVTKVFNSFIIKDTNTEKSYAKKLTKDLLNQNATYFEVSGDLNNIETVYVIDEVNTKEYISNSINNNFASIALRYKNENSYIAYNKTSMVSSVKNDIEIVNTFYPLVSLNTLLFYVISPVINSAIKADINFRKYDDNNNAYYENWSLGTNPYGITIISDIDLNNSETYELNISQISQKYIVSNNIVLDDEYVIASERHSLSEYIITTPNELYVSYTNEIYSEVITAEDDLFNKLHYSNIIQIKDIVDSNMNTISSSNYELLSDEGILVWNNSSYIGESVVIEYEYKKPEFLKYTDLSYLYKAVSYTVDAYELIKDETYKNLLDGDTVNKTITDYDKIVIKCSNPNFQSVSSNNIITVLKAESDNKVAIKYGYVYDGGNECWYFNNRYIDEYDQTGAVRLENVKKINGRFYLYEESFNSLPYSNMSKTTMRELCSMNFRDRVFSNTNTLSSLSSCESFALWHTFNTDVNLVKLENGNGIEFASENSTASYAVLEITDYIGDGYMLSLYADKDLKCFICTEYTVDDMSFAKSVCIKDFTDMKVKNTFYRYHIFDGVNKELRYYLLIQGSGCIDDIIAIKDDNPDNIAQYHERNFNKLKFEYEEKATADTEYYIPFNKLGVISDGLDFNSEKITMGTTVDYGITLIAKIDLSDCILNNAVIKKDCIVAEDNDASLITPVIYCANHESMLKTIAKINDVFIDGMNDFEIIIHNSKTKSGTYQAISTTEKDNIAQASYSKNMGAYFKIEVKMLQKSSIVNSIELYAKYAEKDNINLSVINNSSGSIITTVYDIGVSGNYKIEDIIYESNNDANVLFYIRACRYDDRDTVWTEWKEFEAKKDITFNGYQYFQLKVVMYGENTYAKIDKIILKGF